MKINAFIILLLLLNLFVKAQVAVGLRAEPILYLTNIEVKRYLPQQQTSNEHSFESNLNLTLAFSVNLSDKIKLTIKPGFILGDLFSGINTGFFGNYFITPKRYLITGINLHTRSAWGGHTYSGNAISTSYLALGYGVYISNKFPIEFQINYPLNNEVYGIYKENYNQFNSTIWHYYRTCIMIKVGFGLQWEL